jgi:uncharacterized protein
VQITQSFELPCPPSEAWPVLHDITLLVDCLPGASLNGPLEADKTPLCFEVKLGPIAAVFLGTGQVSFDEERYTVRFEGTAADRRTSSRVKGGAEFALSACDGGSSIEVNVDYALSGTLAQFSRAGIVRELAALLTEQFASNLSQRLQPQLAPHIQMPSAQTDDRTPAPISSAPLSAGFLLRKMLKARWVRLVERLRSS